jgi:hypothetical protein
MGDHVIRMSRVGRALQSTRLGSHEVCATNSLYVGAIKPGSFATEEYFQCVTIACSSLGLDQRKSATN